MKNELELSAKTFGLDIEQAEKITKGLDTILSERVALKDTYEEVINLEITEENISTFKCLRLAVRDNRTKGLKVWHKTNKAFYLAGGNFVQALYNKEVAENERMEENLLKAENHFENLEFERLKELQLKRLELVNPYVEYAELVDYSIMEEDFFNDYLHLKKTKFEKAEAEAKAELERAEKERLEEIERQKAIEIENAKLKKEAKQRENAEILRLEVEKKEREKREELAKEEKAKQDAILLKAKQDAEKLAKELRAKQDAELRAKQEAEDLKEKLRLAEIEKAKAPIKEKLTIWIESLELKNPPIENDVTNDILVKFNSFKDWASKQVNK